MFNKNNMKGYCNCQKEYIGETCEILYQDLICPQNCSNNGICSFDQGETIKNILNQTIY